MSLWFSATAISDPLALVLAVDPSRMASLTLAVQLGFVVGAAASAVANVGDRVPARRLFAVSAVAGAVVNGGHLLLGRGYLRAAVALRFLIGVALAGVYPSGMKAVAGWFRERRGTALGVLVGALTVGSALPDLVRGIGADWRVVLGASSTAALLAAVIMARVDDGRDESSTSRFSWSHLGLVVRHDGFRLSTLGYVGHMWELYAMWTWVAAYIRASGGLDPVWGAFVVIAVGAVGSWLGGLVADAKGRAVAAGGALLVSGTMAVPTPAVFGASPVLTLVVLAAWGVSVVADSAQFSAMATEVVPAEVRGTALALQTAVGFVTTVASIAFVSILAEPLTWRWVFLALVPGPVAGVRAMWRIRRSRWRTALAGGLG